MLTNVMCKDKQCPQRKQCHRYTGKPTEPKQQWFAMVVRGTEVCNFFYPNGTH